MNRITENIHTKWLPLHAFLNEAPHQSAASWAYSIWDHCQDVPWPVTVSPQYFVSTQHDESSESARATFSESPTESECDYCPSLATSKDPSEADSTPPTPPLSIYGSSPPRSPLPLNSHDPRFVEFSESLSRLLVTLDPGSDSLSTDVRSSEDESNSSSLRLHPQQRPVASFREGFNTLYDGRNASGMLVER
jgi:hypothetical protein